MTHITPEQERRAPTWTWPRSPRKRRWTSNRALFVYWLAFAAAGVAAYFSALGAVYLG